jgi:hypothetical protein
VLIERVESMDTQSAALVESLRAGTSRLASDLSAVETNMAELYDAAAGRGGDAGVAVDSPPAGPPVPDTDTGADAPVRQGHSEFIPVPPVPVPGPASPTASVPSVLASVASPSVPPVPPIAASPAPPRSEPQAGSGNGDLDGARLIALNMALNGDSREAIDRYLAEHYQLGDRQKPLEEVFAAVDG